MKKLTTLLLVYVFLLPVMGQNEQPERNLSFPVSLLSHLSLSAGVAGTWGATPGASLFVKKDEKVKYTGTQPSVEFDTSKEWGSNYTFYGGFAGLKFGWLSVGGAYESFKMVPHDERFSLENTAHGIEISLPTVSIKGQIISARAEITIAPHGSPSPFLAVSYPISYSLKSLSYNSSPEPVELKNEAYTLYGVKITPYENTDIPAKFSPAFEFGFGIRLKGRVRLRLLVNYRQLRWNLSYHEHRDEIIIMGAYLGI